jgi:hypothetical protein
LEPPQERHDGSAALTLALLAFGAGLGLSSISPWQDSGISSSTFKIGSGIYLVIVAVMSSAIGGYLASRLRDRFIGLHTNEVFFRDTAHHRSALAGLSESHIVNKPFAEGELAAKVRAALAKVKPILLGR